MDKDGDGLISAAELTAFVADKGGELELIEQLIKTLDVDGDGMLSKNELMSLMH